MMRKKIDWAAQPLGEIPDAVLARKLGITRRGVGLARQERGIASSSGRKINRPSRISKKVWDSLPYGEISDVEIAQALGVHRTLVSQHRNRRSVAPCRSRAPVPVRVRTNLEKILREVRGKDNNTEGMMKNSAMKKKSKKVAAQKAAKRAKLRLCTETKIGEPLDIETTLAQLQDLSDEYPMEMKTTILTPEFCENILRTHTSNFRRFYPAYGARITFAMLAGEWQFNIVDNIVIVVHKDYLEPMNGQHRMYGVMKSGIPQPFLVVFITPEMRDVYDIDKGDTGKARTTTDVAFNKKLDANALRIIKALCEQELYGTFSKGLAVLNHHWFLERVLEDNLTPVSGSCETKKLGKRKGVNNVFRVAIARALYTQHKGRVMEFADQVINMYHTDRQGADSAAHLISKFITEVRESGASFTGTEMGLKYYLRLEWAIKQFCERKKVNKLQAAPGIGSLLPIDLGGSKLLNFAREFIE